MQQASGRLPLSELQALDIIGQSPVAITLVVGPNYIIQSANKKQLSLWNKTSEEVIDQSLADIFPDVNNELLVSVYQTGKSQTIVETPQWFFGSPYALSQWYRYELQPVKNDLGDVEGVLVFSTDVSDIVKATTAKHEEVNELSANDAETLLTHLQLATASADVGTWLLDVQAGTLEWSPLHKKMWGYDENRRDLLYEHWHNVIHPDDKERCLQEVQNSLREKRLYEIDYRVLPANGAPLRWMRSVGKYQFSVNGQATTMTGISMDITDEMMAREALQQSERQFRSTFDNAAIGIAHLNLDGKWTLVNNRTSEITGYSREELLQKRFHDITHPDDLTEDLRLLKELLEGRLESYTIEKRYLHKNGSVVWANLTRSLVRDKDGTPDYFITFVEDINERKKAEEKLQESNERLQAALDASLTGTFQWNIQTNELSWDENLDRLFGLPLGATIRNLDKFIECVHPDDRIGVIERCQLCAVEGADFEMEFRVVYPDGSLHWLYDKGKTFLDEEGKPGYMTGACVDITERKKAEDIIRESESRFRTLVESLPQMVWVRTVDGEIEYASRSWIDYSGVEDTSEAWKTMAHPDDLAGVMQEWEEANKKESSFRHEVRLKNRDGEYHWYNSIAEPIRDQSGKLIKWIGALTDIQVQKTFSEKLEKEVEERTKELQRSNEDLQQFAHVASHDLKEPVRKIRIFEGKLKDEFGHLLTDKAKDYLRKIETSADRMHLMIDGVLKYASTLNERHVMDEEVDLDLIITDIETDLEVVMVKKGAVINRNNLGTVQGSSILLYQLFYNLVNNSLKFSVDGVKPIIQITSSRDPEWTQIVVRDNGIGFSQEMEHVIFQTFTRLNSKDKYEGTGLGLSLCKKIVERHEGKIKAFGEEGKGASFVVTIPVRS